jgi:hypothetical protein
MGTLSLAGKKTRNYSAFPMKNKALRSTQQDRAKFAGSVQKNTHWSDAAVAAM